MIAAILALLVSVPLVNPDRQAQREFIIPHVTDKPDKDKEIRWYSCASAPSAITSNGELLKDWWFTFASRDLPFGTRIKVTYKGRSAQFRCNDRGPNHVELTLGGFAFFENPDIGVLRGAKIEILYD